MGATDNHPDKEDSMVLIEVKVIEGVFTPLQKQEIIERLTAEMLEIQGESLRSVTWCVVQEIHSGDSGIGGGSVTADDVRALARGEVATSHGTHA
jgi:4-oxalocrotonate tautomerase